MRRHCLRAAVGGVVCLCAVCSLEVSEFSRLSDFACHEQPEVRDFGPPGNCGEGTGPHTRRYSVVSVSASTSAISTGYAVFDPEHGIDLDPWQPTRPTSA
jgi:hypothetical protein